MRRAAILSSGGMDSYLLAYRLHHLHPLHVFVDVGQKYVVKERAAAQLVADLLRADFVSATGAHLSADEHPSGIIPFRNTHLILAAARHAEDIYLGVIAHEVNSDKSEGFLDAMAQVLNISHQKQYWTDGRTFRLLTPLREHTKTELVRMYLEDGGMVAPLLRTVSCYADTLIHCGRCASCFKRWVALRNNGLTQAFDQDPAEWKTAAVWRRMLPGYHEARAAEIRMALRSAGVDV